MSAPSTRAPRALSCLAAAWFVAAVTAGSGAARAEEPSGSSGGRVEARPGGLVRWPAEGIESCHRDERSWTPFAGACWFPIDLLEAEGEIAVHRSRNGARESATISVGSYPYPVQRITIEDTSRVELSAENLARVRKEQGRVRRLWALEGPPLFELPLAEPLDDLGKGGSFGSRRYFNDQPRSPHSGADYSASEGTPVFSVGPGRVALADDLFFSGKSVFVDHGDGLISMYFHLSELMVDEGQQVDTRELVGKVGMTGRTTGPHLHFGLRWKGARVDPALLLGRSSPVPELGAGMGAAAVR